MARDVDITQTRPALVTEQAPEPGSGQDAVGSDDVAAAPRVTQAVLTVGVDPADPCRLALSGVITTDRPMTVELRDDATTSGPSRPCGPSRSTTRTRPTSFTTSTSLAAPSPIRPAPLAATPGAPWGRPRHHRSTDPIGLPGCCRVHVTAPHGLWSDGGQLFNVEPCHRRPPRPHSSRADDQQVLLVTRPPEPDVQQSCPSRAMTSPARTTRVRGG